MPRTSQRPLALLIAVPLLLVPSHAQQPATASPDSGLTLKANTNLVVLDVVVTDSHEQPVHNLHATDFAIREDNNTQQIRNFEEHITPPPAAKPALPPGVFTNYSPNPSNGPLNILLIDTLNTRMGNGVGDQAYVRLQVLKYLKDAHPSSPIAIFVLSNKPQHHLSLVQSFTEDPELLRSAATANGIENSSLLELSSNSVHSGSSPTGIGRNPNADQASIAAQIRVQYTMEAMAQLVHYLSNFSGRKNLIWFSSTFPLGMMSSGAISHLFSRTQIAVNTVNAHGLDPLISAASDSATGDQTLIAERAALFQLADETGGHSLTDNNGIAAAIKRDIDFGSNYYTLTYAPTDTTYNGAFRKIQVDLQQKGYTLAYRRGYFADPSTPASTKKGTQPTAISSPPDAVHLAMVYGAPQPNDIVFKARILPATPITAPAELKPASGNITGPDATRTHGPYRNYLIDISALPRTLTYTQTPDGHHHADLEYMTIAYDRDGAVITSTSNTLHLDLTPDTYAQLLREGLPLHQQISVPAKGDFALRIGIHDANSDHIGAIELPLNKITNLPPNTEK